MNVLDKLQLFAKLEVTTDTLNDPMCNRVGPLIPLYRDASYPFTRK